MAYLFRMPLIPRPSKFSELFFLLATSICLYKTFPMERFTISEAPEKPLADIFKECIKLVILLKIENAPSGDSFLANPKGSQPFFSFSDLNANKRFIVQGWKLSYQHCIKTCVGFPPQRERSLSLSFSLFLFFLSRLRFFANFFYWPAEVSI